MEGQAESNVQHYRQEDFHHIFRSVGRDERLIDTFACALSREILLQGRLFLGERHVCFHANILGWITNVVIALEDIVLIERKNTALLFPNAVLISTLHHRYFFASFIFREQAFLQIFSAWKSAIRRENDESPVVNPSMFLSNEPGLAHSFEFDQAPPSSFFASYHSEHDDGPSDRCDEHLSSVFVHVNFSEVDHLKVSRLLFENEDGQLEKFYVDSGNSYSASPWTTLIAGLEQRTGHFTFEGRRGNLYQAAFTETYVTSRSHPRLVVECSLKIDGIAGKGCLVQIKYSLMDRTTTGCHLCISFDVMPGPDVLFKESFKKLVVGDLYRHFARMGESLLRQMGVYDVCETASISPVGSPRRSSSGSVQVFFDRAAFVKSAVWLLPVLLLATLVIYSFNAGPRHGAFVSGRGSPQDLEERVALVMRDLSDQLALRLLRKEQIRQKLVELLGSISNSSE